MSKTAVLLVSFGSTYPDARHATDKAADAAFAKMFPEATLFHAYTSTIVMRRVKQNEGVQLDDVATALRRIETAGFDNLIVQSLHIIPGIEYSRLLTQLASFKGHFAQVSVGKPLLTSFSDFQTVVTWLTAVGTKTPGQAVVFMGHGTEDHAFTTYACLDHMLSATNVYMGAVESYPDIHNMIAELKRDGITEVTVRPFMMVAGNHVHHDMVSDAPTSWSSQLTAAGFKVNADLTSLASASTILNLFATHAKEALEAQDD